MGFLTRHYGLSCDNLVGADVVTADGKLVRADAERNPDLLWALRGGGGSFGGATSLQYPPHNVAPEGVMRHAVYPAQAGPAGREEVDDAIVELSGRAAAGRPSALSSVNIWALGGAMRNEPEGGSAFAQRDQPFLFGIEANWDAPDDDATNLGGHVSCSPR